ncbi:BON domain-containing protein [Rickettsiales endosymbiont of Stachyamoeba lipophora]|uniref:BON domain-containing protein n=1 Tax=Rickettsiales endosymbiont of Stachyamoeba lipophora TaxID=2486578 RepID=UPI000F65443D|nr:BON domain-containing protein [Rickettsiales endosymbiont of Stachyamoeba lipophora]AZL16056.1 BON domain-containing protein [Rickettsiales endosymbiont of Stachyamoeba lipophora]
MKKLFENMSFVRKLIIVSLPFVVSVTTSCIPAVLGGSMATGVVLVQDRTAGQKFDDLAIKAKIRERYFRKDVNNLFAKIKVEVANGRVLLTGSVVSQEDRLKAVRIAWKVNGVREVINEIEIRNIQGLEVKDYATDTWITTQLRTKMLFYQNIKSFNYNIETIRGVIYLIGVTKSKQELDMVTAMASQIRNVRKVVSYVKIVSSMDYPDNDNVAAPYETKVEKVKAVPLKPLVAPKPLSVKEVPIETGSDDLDEFDD